MTCLSMKVQFMAIFCHFQEKNVISKANPENQIFLTIVYPAPHFLYTGILLGARMKKSMENEGNNLCSGKSTPSEDPDQKLL